MPDCILLDSKILTIYGFDFDEPVRQVEFIPIEEASEMSLLEQNMELPDCFTVQFYDEHKQEIRAHQYGWSLVS